MGDRCGTGLGFACESSSRPAIVKALEVLSEVRDVQVCAALCRCGLTPVAADGAAVQLAALEVATVQPVAAEVQPVAAVGAAVQLAAADGAAVQLAASEVAAGQPVAAKDGAVHLAAAREAAGQLAASEAAAVQPGSASAGCPGLELIDIPLGGAGSEQRQEGPREFPGREQRVHSGSTAD